MKFPIIELRQTSLFVSMEFFGTIVDSRVVLRHNFAHNYTKYVLDSNGDLWSLTFIRTNHVGVRKLLSALWNVSSDYYTYTKSVGITVAEFRRIAEPYLRAENPDDKELASALLEPLAQCKPTDILRENIHLMNL